jgi:hypothetical protein
VHEVPWLESSKRRETQGLWDLEYLSFQKIDMTGDMNQSALFSELENIQQASDDWKSSKIYKYSVALALRLFPQPSYGCPKYARRKVMVVRSFSKNDDYTFMFCCFLDHRCGNKSLCLCIQVEIDFPRRPTSTSMESVAGLKSMLRSAVDEIGKVISNTGCVRDAISQMSKTETPMFGNPGWLET